MPEPKSMLEATSEANNLASLSEAKDYYVHGMEAVCGGDKPYINEHVIEIEHLRIRDAAIEVFTSKRKMGGEEFSAKYRQQVKIRSLMVLSRTVLIIQKLQQLFLGILFEFCNCHLAFFSACLSNTLSPPRHCCFFLCFYTLSLTLSRAGSLAFLFSH